MHSDKFRIISQTTSALQIRVCTAALFQISRKQ